MRLMHTMIRVGDLSRSIDFYTQILGMQLLRTTQNTEYQYDLAFVGYGAETDHTVIELTYNYGVTNYELGSAFGHLAIEVEDIYAICNTIRSKGQVILREPGPVKGGTSLIAFISDPDGYKIELIQRKCDLTF